jgi:ribosome-associated protein
MPRKKTESKPNSEPIVQAIIKGMLDKKAKDPVVLRFSKVNAAVCDAFVICHGTSRTQIEAIAEAVVVEVKKECDESPWQKEGFENAEWILIDYFSVVVHIFQDTRRNFYNLEQLWGDAKIEKIKSP